MTRSNQNQNRPPTDPYIEKGLPSNVECERAVLGGILLENSLMDEVLVRLRRDHLYLDSHRRIFDRMIECQGKSLPIDLITLTDALRRAGEFEQVGGATYIASLIDGVPRTDSVEHYIKIIREKALYRRLISLSNLVAAECFEEEKEAQQVLLDFDIKLRNLEADNIPGCADHIVVAAERVVRQIEKRSETGDRMMLVGLPTGFTDLDQATGGLKVRNLIIMAARPSMGKTSMVTGIGMNAAIAGKKVLFFSLEMAVEELMVRMLASEARLDSVKVERGYLSQSDIAKLCDALRRFQDRPFWVDDTGGLKMSELRARARRFKNEFGLDLVIVDYLQLIEGEGRYGSRQEEVSMISKGLKELAKELEAPVLAVSQLSRGPELRKNKRPKLSDLRESGQIEQDADVVIFLHREEVFDPTEKNKGVAEILIRKQRMGKCPADVELAFLKEYTRFENMWRQAGFGDDQ